MMDHPTTLGYVRIDYTFEDNRYFRVSTINKPGDHVKQFISELETFVYNIELKCPVSLEFSVFAGCFINNKSDNVINLNLKVV